MQPRLSARHRTVVNEDEGRAQRHKHHPPVPPRRFTRQRQVAERARCREEDQRVERQHRVAHEGTRLGALVPSRSMQCH
eukprot:1454518-Pleurochrysis_carterae.AAC.1